jgi:hypothetical protein
MTDNSIDAEALVQRQLDAYNTYNRDALLATYAGEGWLFEHPATL